MHRTLETYDGGKRFGVIVNGLCAAEFWRTDDGGWRTRRGPLKARLLSQAIMEVRGGDARTADLFEDVLN